MGHIVRVERLFQVLINPEFDVQILRIFNLISGDKIWSHRRKCVPRFHLIESVTSRLEPTGRAIYEVNVTKYVIVSVLLSNVASPLADNQCDLSLTLEYRGGDIRQDHGVAVANHGIGRFLECVDRGRFVPRSVFHVVHSHTDDVRWFGQR